MSTTESVLEHHLETFGERDLDGIMEDYADNAVLITQTETYSGEDEIREMFSEWFPEFDDPSVTFSLEEQLVVTQPQRSRQTPHRPN